MMVLGKAALLTAALWGSYFAVLVDAANLQPDGGCSLLVLLPFTSTYVRSFVACLTLAMFLFLCPLHCSPSSNLLLYYTVSF